MKRGILLSWLFAAAVISAQVNAQTSETPTPEASALDKVLFAPPRVEHDSRWRASLADALHRYCESVLVQVPQNTSQEDQRVDSELHEASGEEIDPNWEYERWSEAVRRQEERLDRVENSVEYARKVFRRILSACSSLTNDLIKRKSTSVAAEALLWSQLSEYFAGEDEVWRVAEIIGLVSPSHCSHRMLKLSAILRETDEIVRGIQNSKPPGEHDQNNICSFWGGANNAVIHNVVIPLLRGRLATSAGTVEKRDVNVEKRDVNVEKRDVNVEKRDVNVVVKYCVDEVRKDQSYKYFDAFYNSATNRVQNNLTYVYQQGALFVFNKCMAVQGFPLH